MMMMMMILDHRHASCLHSWTKASQRFSLVVAVVVVTVVAIVTGGDLGLSNTL